MANTRSATKRVRQSLKRRERNRAQKSEMRTYEKRILKLVVEKKTEGLEELYRKYTSRIDRIVKKKIIHKNRASRRKSRLSFLVKTTLGQTVPDTSSTPVATEKE